MTFHLAPQSLYTCPLEHAGHFGHFVRNVQFRPMASLSILLGNARRRRDDGAHLIRNEEKAVRDHGRARICSRDDVHSISIAPEFAQLHADAAIGLAELVHDLLEDHRLNALFCI